jgi:acetyl esterase/lipase
LQGKLKKETFDLNTSIKDFRDICESGANKYAKIPVGITIKETTIDNIRAEWLVPEGADPKKIILYVHGGGYVSGSCNDHRSIVSKFAKSVGYTNLLYEYRLAPEFPFPAALDDSLKVYKWLLARGTKPGNIILAGESAGGGLALAMLLALKEKNIDLPAAAVSISPWLDLTCGSESYKTKNRVSLAPLNSWAVFSKYYVGNNNATYPLISPLYGDLNGLPPIFINAGAADELFDESEKFYKKAKECGINITFRAGIDMVHCYPLLAPLFSEAVEAMDEICQFIRGIFIKNGSRT